MNVFFKFLKLINVIFCCKLFASYLAILKINAKTVFINHVSVMGDLFPMRRRPICDAEKSAKMYMPNAKFRNVYSRIKSAFRPVKSATERIFRISSNFGEASKKAYYQMSQREASQ
jgi:hypothetical protein